MFNILKKHYTSKKKYTILKKGGRNNAGRITSRHRGGGHKRLFYNTNWIDQSLNNILIGKIIKKSYNLPLGIYYNKEKKKILFYDNILENQLFNKLVESNKKGKINLLKNITVGTYIYNIENAYNKGPVFCRSKFSFGQLLQFIKNKVIIKLPSKKKKILNNNNKSFILSNINLIKQGDNFNKKKLKAGVSRWLGKRPKVRGVAMNPIDHPHGGGEGKTSGGRFSCSPTGILSKGFKTKRKKHEKVKI